MSISYFVNQYYYHILYFMIENFETDRSETEELRKTLSNNIRIFRRDLHLTQEQLAENADISLSYLADIEHCKTWISDKTLLKLSKALHKQPYELLINDTCIENKDKNNINIISDILHNEKKDLIKTVSDIYDRTIQKIINTY